jgi:Leucine-rich repeat (LRR) protein
MCEQLGKGCACRLALTLGRMQLLEHVDVSCNALPALPEELLQLPRLRLLQARGNALTALGSSSSSSWGAVALEELDLRDNALRELPGQQLAALPRLQRLLCSGNPLSEAAQRVLQGLRDKGVHCEF